MSDPYPPLRPQPPVRARRRASPLPMVIGVVVLAILAVVLLLIVLDGNEPTGSASPTPGASGDASASAAGSPSAAPSGDASASPTSPDASASAAPVAVGPPTGITPVGSLVTVTADGLRLREEPTTSGAVLATLAAGETLFLVTNPNSLGPVEADGFSWYVGMYAPGYADWPLNPPGFGDGPSGDPRVFGWFAAGSESEDFVELQRARCPVGTDIDGLYAATPWERLSCLGDQQITVEGTYGCGGCGGLAPGTFDPEWLADPINFHLLTPPWADLPPVVEQLVLHVPPDVAAPGSEQAGSVLRVTGHFDDARSTDCVIAPGEPGSEVPANELAAEWYCRLQFVVESWAVVGTDPDWVAG